jgi:hypothetical protein
MARIKINGIIFDGARRLSPVADESNATRDEEPRRRKSKPVPTLHARILGSIRDSIHANAFVLNDRNYIVIGEAFHTQIGIAPSTQASVHRILKIRFGAKLVRDDDLLKTQASFEFSIPADTKFFMYLIPSDEIFISII